MDPHTDSGPSSLFGELGLILTAAVPIAAVLSLVLLGIYRRAVMRSMGARSPGAAAEPSPSHRARAAPARPPAPAMAAPPQAARGELSRRTLSGPWRAAAVECFAGAACATTMTAAWLVADRLDVLPLRTLGLFTTEIWPVVLTVNLIAASTRRRGLAAPAAYGALFIVIWALALAAIPALTVGQIVLLWVISNGYPTLLLAAFLNRRVRAVGPIVLVFVLTALGGSFAAIDVLGASRGNMRLTVEVGARLGLGAAGILASVMFAGLFLAAVLGWLVVAGIRRAYEQKRLSDQSLTLGAIWLLFGIWRGLMLANTHREALWILVGPAVLLVHTIAARAGRAALAERGALDASGPRLLLLRVFALGARGALLFERLGKHWLRVGSIQLIAGPDLATTTIEPHELLDFVSGRLARRFIDGPAAMEGRVAEIDTLPDRDGRFRVTEFFCHDDTWRMVLSRLAHESDAVLMDLRGFTRNNAGCRFEIGALLARVPLGRVVFVVDDTTDSTYLRAVLDDEWRAIPADSPNRRDAAPTPRLYAMNDRSASELPGLVGLLCEAAAGDGP